MAQVTIGSSNAPKSGALLDLKQSDEKGSNSNKGLLLPKVNLTNSTNLFPMFSNDADYENAASGKKVEQDRLHTGLLVYNVNECLTSTGKSKGVYMWMGTEWSRLGNKQNLQTDDAVNVNYDHEHNSFYSRKFGVAGEWMLQNLQVSSYSDDAGTSLGEASVGISDKTKRWAYPTSVGGDPTSPSIFNKQQDLGYLYNWYAALKTDATAGVDQGEGSANALGVGMQGVCPYGWHVPSDVEWNTLENHISSHPADYSYLTSAETIDPGAVGDRGTHSKAFRLMCLPIELAEKSDGLSFLKNEGGFSALLAGTISQGSALGFGENTAYWTASSKDGSQSWQRVFAINKDAVNRSGRVATDMLSVRCKKNEQFQTCGDPLSDSEGNEYRTARFGGAGCWMTQNLMSTINTNVKLDENTNVNDETGLFYAKTNATEINPDFGYLYTWDAAMGGQNPEETLIASEGATAKSNIQGICPEGWVLPSDYEWSMLEKEIYTNPTAYSNVTTIGTWTDYESTTGWRTGNENGWGQHFKSATVVGGVTHSKPSSSSKLKGAEVLLVGSLESGSAQNTFGSISNTWSSNDVFTGIGSDSRANYRGVSHDKNDMYRDAASKSSMLSVRCKLKE